MPCIILLYSWTTLEPVKKKKKAHYLKNLFPFEINFLVSKEFDQIRRAFPYFKAACKWISNEEINDVNYSAKEICNIQSKWN